jgi:F420-dependent methylenetetrahydromethanopterin dehydrogenase
MNKTLVEIFQLLLSELLNNPEKQVNTKTEDLELLTKDKLTAITSNNIVPGSDAAAAYLKKGDDKIYIYLAYLKGRELIEESKNNYVIITADAISREVEKLFDEHELIIFK